MAHILLIEDDPDIASLLRRGLAAAGHSSVHTDCHAGAREALGRQPFDAAIVDMMLGEESGAEILADLRAAGHKMPALMLSALSRVEERAEGLDAGAQDYIVKPFQFTELLARLEVQLRRHIPQSAPLVLAGLSWNPETRLVRGAGRDVALTEREGELLAWLIRHSGEISTRGAIFDALWAPHGGSTDNVVDVYIGYLRRKLGNFTAYGLVLRTLRGRGFVLEPAGLTAEETAP
ncbi:response regulator transcription factor [Falsigemmobacter intermedius]|uniref:Response regulator transcription factor n=1 Tax=Falsigemmobacter intermedius TaxID=1553448 RepID=A0A3S3WNQ9_9RHOB|nr:response regulator transcription factor [Falsigemmobacter intermedius]RWY41464.1 response regulator transcription factor [Falsigemmobacter intermedius]